MSEDESREQFETWWISGEVKLPVLVSEHSMFFADQAWQACAKIKDAEIAGLTKQRNAYKTADDARNKLIDWKVETGVKEKTKELNSLSSERDANAILTEEIEQLDTELERERMRLAACGVVALANTEESATKARLMHDDYRSASCDDVARMVDVQMKLRTQVEQLNAKVAMMRSLLAEVTSANDYLNSNWFDARQAIFNATEADVTKFLNGVRADAVAEYRRQAQATMCAKVVR
jgi:hypothetical protein